MLSYGMAISGYKKGVQWEGALAVLQEMLRRQLQLDEVNRIDVISACAKGL